MNKFMQKAIPICIISIFIVIMLSGNYLKKSFVEQHNVPEAMEIVMKNVNEEKWEEATRNTEVLNDIWSKIVRRIQFSSERNEINDLNVSLSRLRGAILTRDKNSAIMELNEAYTHWENLSR